MKDRVLIALAALLLIAAGQDYNALPPVYAPHIYDSDLPSGDLVGATTNSELTPITLGSGFSIVAGALTYSYSGGTTIYNASGTTLSTGPFFSIEGISGSCTTSSGACNASVSWTKAYSSSTSYWGVCSATAAGSTNVQGTDFVPSGTTTATAEAITNGGGTHAVTFTCSTYGY